MKKSIVLITFIILLSGCNANVEQLRQTNKELIKEVAVLKNQLQESEIKLNNVLKAKELETKDEVTSDFNIFNEGQFIKGDLYILSTLSIKDIRNTFGEPIEIKESVSSHGSYKESILTYKNASFTFESIEDVDHIKWYTIKEPNIFTIRGVSVGSTASEVIQAYDKGFYNFHVSDDMIFFGEKTGMSFKLNKGVVIEIKVWFMYE